MTDIVTDRMVSAADAALRGHNVDLSDREMRAAITAALGAMWRPIAETNTETNDDCMLWAENFGKPCQGYYDQRDKFWYCIDGDQIEPTHFAPLICPLTQKGEG